MKSVISIVLVACSSSPAPTQAPSSPPPPIDAAIDAVSIDAAPAIDPALTAAPASVFRFYSTGLVPMKAGPRLETWTLRTAGEQGLLVVERMAAADDKTWQLSSTSRYLGTATDDGKTLALALADGANKLALACTRDKLSAALATAVRKPHPKGKYKACTDPGRWVPDKTGSVDVLRCMHPDFETPMLFAPAPGVEYLYVNDDCQMQGGGYRTIAADGAIAPER